MTLIQQNRYDQLLRRVGDLKGGGSKVADVLTELFPMFDVESNRGELQLLSGMRLCMDSTNQAATPGSTSRSQLFNPANSGVIGIVTSLYVDNVATSATINLTTTIVPFVTAAGVGLFRDTRLGTTGTPSLQARADVTVAVTAPTLVFHILPDTPLKLEDENGIIVLAPGTGIEIGSAATDRALTVDYFWRERVAEPSELSF